MRNTYQMGFPAVTICNANRVHCGHLYEGIMMCADDVSIHIQKLTRSSILCAINPSLFSKYYTCNDFCRILGAPIELNFTVGYLCTHNAQYL